MSRTDPQTWPILSARSKATSSATLVMTSIENPIPGCLSAEASFSHDSARIHR